MVGPQPFGCERLGEGLYRRRRRRPPQLSMLDAFNEHVSRLSGVPRNRRGSQVRLCIERLQGLGRISWALTRGRGSAMADPVLIRADPIQGEPVNQTGFQPLPESD